jgi:hypothetical protein
METLLISTAINIATDLLMAALPVPMLWNVQINKRVKASLICIMGLGILQAKLKVVTRVLLTLS